MLAFAGIFAGEIHGKKSVGNLLADVIWVQKIPDGFFEISIRSFSHNDIYTFLSMLAFLSERKIFSGVREMHNAFANLSLHNSHGYGEHCLVNCWLASQPLQGCLACLGSNLYLVCTGRGLEAVGL